VIWTHETGPADAPVIVLVHGSMDRSASLVRLARQLDEDFRVVRYDRRGYGRSKPHEGPFTVTAQVDDLRRVLDGRRPVVTFGHSYGGNVALAAVARDPQVTASVCVFEVPLSWFDWWPGTTRRWNTADTDPGDVAERFMRRVVGDSVWERLPGAVRAERRSEGWVLDREIHDLAAAAPWTAEQITVPVRAVYGAETAGHHRDATHLLAGLLSDEPAVCIEGAGHTGPATHPGAVAAAIRELAGLSLGTGPVQ
jgi:pimeloyl-ACP methyl ester carboxylesterase